MIDRCGYAMMKKTNIPRSVIFFLLFTKLFGSFGGSIKNGRVRKSSVFGKIYSATWLIIMYYYIGYKDHKTTNFVEIFSQGLMEHPHNFFQQFLFIAGEIFVSIFQQKKIVRFFDKLYDYDKKVENIGFIREDKTMIYWIMGSLPIIGIFIDQSRESQRKKLNTVGKAVIAYYYAILQYVIVMKFCLFVHLIYRRFKFLNEYITKRIHRGNVIFKHQSVTIYDVRYLHTKLCDAGDCLAEVYGVWVVFWCSQVAVTITKVLQFYINNSATIPDYVPLFIIWLLTLCWTCGVTSFEANQISKRLLEARSFSGDAADTMDGIDMAMYLCNHEIYFTAGHIYLINRPFLLQMISILLTYITYVSDS